MKIKKKKINFHNLSEYLVTVNKLKPVSYIDFKYEIKVKLLNNNFKDNLITILKLPFLTLKVLINNFFFK